MLFKAIIGEKHKKSTQQPPQTDATRRSRKSKRQY